MSAVECLACGHVSKPKTKGSFIITLILLFFWLIPGVIYEIWRRSSGKVCGACGSHNIRLYIPQPRVIQQVAQPQEVFIEPTQPKTKLVASDVFSYNKGEEIQLNDDGVEVVNCPYCRELIRFDARKCKHCGSMVDS